MKNNAILAAALALLLLPGAAFAQENFNDKQKEAIEKIVKDYLINKEPRLVMDAAQAFQKKQDDENKQKSSEAVGKNKDKLQNSANDPVAGNPKGDVTVVEFFDYNCGYCKKANEPLRKLLEEDKNVKIVFKEYPILSESSKVAAKAALAANKQKKYLDFHNAVMEHKGTLSEDALMEIAGKVGLDKDKLKKDMASPDIDAIIAEVNALGREIGASGTPTFVIGDKIVPGAMGLDEMKKLVDEARKNIKK